MKRQAEVIFRDGDRAVYPLGHSGAWFQEGVATIEVVVDETDEWAAHRYVMIPMDLIRAIDIRPVP